jgi:hypothetical protein
MSAADDFDPSMFADIPDPVAPVRGAAGGDDSKGAAVAPAASSDRSLPAFPAQRSTRAEVSKRRSIALAISFGWTLFAVVILGYRHNLDAISALVHLALPLALGIVVLAVAISPGRLGLGPSARKATLLAVVAPVAFMVVAALLRVPMAADDHRDTLGCGAIELGVGLVPLVLLAVGLRRTQVVNAGWRSTLFGAGMGLVWAGLWAIHCTDSDAAHIVLAHGGAAAGLAIVGGLVVSRFTRVR